MTTQTSTAAQWFALHTLSGQENKVKTYIEKFKKAEELEDFIAEVLLPTEVVSEVKGGKKSTKVRKLYPGYVFINMRLYDENSQVIIKPFYFVKDAGGVIGFVGGDKPAALRQAEIAKASQGIAAEQAELDARLKETLADIPADPAAWLMERDAEWQHWQQTQRRRQELATQLVQQQERADAAQTQAAHWAEQAAQLRAAATDAPPPAPASTEADPAAALASCAERLAKLGQRSIPRRHSQGLHARPGARFGLAVGVL